MPEELPAYRAADLLNDLLCAPRFQKEIIAEVLRAFPEKKRLLFVHIPKCAGSDLSVHLGAHFPSISQQLSDPRQASKGELFRALGDLVRRLGLADSVLVRGHVNLSYFIDRKLIRPVDRCFTVVRDPIQMAISMVNYVASRIRWNSETRILDLDTKIWLDVLGIGELPATVSESFARQICRIALRNHEIVRPNAICYWLGGGTSAEVLARIRENNVEITDTSRYNSWLLHEWQINAQTRHNESIKFVTVDTLSVRELSYLGEITAEDASLYNAIERSLAKTTRYSITATGLQDTKQCLARRLVRWGWPNQLDKTAKTAQPADPSLGSFFWRNG